MLSDNKRLFFFIEGNEPYIKNEIPYLINYFSNITIFHNKKIDFPFAENENLNIIQINSITKEKNSIIIYVLYFLTINYILIKEFINRKNKNASLKKYRYNLSLVINACKITDYIKKNCAVNDIYYSYWMNNNALSLSIAKRKNIIHNYVLRVHGFDLYKERWPDNDIPFHEICHKYANKIFTISNKATKYFNTNFVAKAETSYLGFIPKGDNPLYTETIRLVSVSNIIPLKQIHLIIESLSHCKAEISWHHFGEGILQEEIIKKAKGLPLNIKYIFHNKVSQEVLFNFYLNNHVSYFINVSETEGLPFSIIEAISFGITVIATDVGGTSEIVNEQTGILLPKEIDTKYIAKIIEDYNNSTYSKTAFRKKTQQFFTTNFLAEKNTLSFIKQISSLK